MILKTRHQTKSCLGRFSKQYTARRTVVLASQSDGNKLNTARAEMGLDDCRRSIRSPASSRQKEAFVAIMMATAAAAGFLGGRLEAKQG